MNNLVKMQAANPIPFGVHIMIDGYWAKGQMMTDEVALRDLLYRLPEDMGMHRICDPVVVSVGPNCHKDPGGLSGFVMIAQITQHACQQRQRQGVLTR